MIWEIRLKIDDTDNWSIKDKSSFDDFATFIEKTLNDGGLTLIEIAEL